MKTLMHATVVTLLLAQAVPVTAQDAVGKLSVAFDNTLKTLSSDVTQTQTTTYSDGYAKIYEYATPKANKSVIEAFDGALRQAIPDVYSSWMKKAGDAGQEELLIGYGEHSLDLYSFGKKAGMNYNIQLLRDPRDPSMRYAFVLVWGERGDSLLGNLCQFYGKDRARHGWMEYVDQKDEEATRPKTAADFISQFTGLASVFSSQLALHQEYSARIKRNDNHFFEQCNQSMTALSGAAGKIMSLSMSYSHLLDSHQKEVLARLLRDLSQQCTSDYFVVKEMLHAAQNALQQ